MGLRRAAGACHCWQTPRNGRREGRLLISGQTDGKVGKAKAPGIDRQGAVRDWCL